MLHTVQDSLIERELGGEKEGRLQPPFLFAIFSPASAGPWRSQPNRSAEEDLITPPRTIGTIGGNMASMSQAPTLILTAPDAVAPPIAMVVRTTAAQRERRRNRR